MEILSLKDKPKISCNVSSTMFIVLSRCNIISELCKDTERWNIAAVSLHNDYYFLMMKQHCYSFSRGIRCQANLYLGIYFFKYYYKPKMYYM